MGEAWPDDVVDMVLYDGDKKVATIELRMSSVLALLRSHQGFKDYMLYQVRGEIGAVNEEAIFGGKEVMVEV